MEAGAEDQFQETLMGLRVSQGMLLGVTWFLLHIRKIVLNQS